MCVLHDARDFLATRFRRRRLKLKKVTSRKSKFAVFPCVGLGSFSSRTAASSRTSKTCAHAVIEPKSAQSCGWLFVSVKNRQLVQVVNLHLSLNLAIDEDGCALFPSLSRSRDMEYFIPENCGITSLSFGEHLQSAV